MQYLKEESSDFVDFYKFNVISIGCSQSCPRHTQSVDKVLITNMYVLSLVILLIFCIQLGIHGNLKIDDVNFGECGQAYRGMLKVLEND